MRKLTYKSKNALMFADKNPSTLLGVNKVKDGTDQSFGARF